MSIDMSKYPPALVEEVQSIIQKAGKQHVKAFDAIVATLTSHGLAWKQQIVPKFVYLHPDNRSSFLVDPARVHKHGHEMVTAGFSPAKAADVLCVEMPPESHPACAEAKKANEELYVIADGLLPPVGDIKYVSLGGGHTNSFLRCLNEGTKTTIAEWGATLDKGAMHAAACISYINRISPSTYCCEVFYIQCMHESFTSMCLAGLL